MQAVRMSYRKSVVAGLAGVCVTFALATVSGCSTQKPAASIPPPPSTATLPAVPANVPTEQQNQARQQMMMSMQSGRDAALHANGQAK